MGIFLEVLGRGLGGDLQGVLHRYYRREKVLSEADLSAQAYAEPLSEDLDLSWGLLHWRESRVEEAREHLVRACCRDAQNIAAHAALACIFEEQGDTNGALEELRILNRLQPNEANLQFALGLCHERTERPGSAALHYRNAVALDETYQVACERLAAVSLQSGHIEEAIGQYEILCRLRPEKLQYRTALGGMLYRAHQYEAAVDAFEGAIVMEPENWAVRDDEVVRLVAEGDIREAIARTQHLLEEQGPFPDIFVQLANLYSLVGDDAPAMNFYLQALEIQPSYLEAMVKLATHHLLFGRWEEATEVFGQAAELNEGVLLNYLGMAVSHAAVGRLDKAAETFQLASAIEPNSSLLLAQMIRLHWKISVADDILQTVDDTTGSIEGGPMRETLLQDELTCHAQRVRQNPRNALARFHYGVLLRVAGRVRQATRQFTRAVRWHPTYMSAQVKLGVCLKEMGRDARAARVFHNLFQPSPDEIQEHYRLGILFHQRSWLEDLAAQRAASAQDATSLPDARSSIALSLRNMGLLDRGAATWRELQQAHRVAT